MEWNKYEGKRLFSIFKELCEKEYSDLIKCIPIEHIWWLIQKYSASCCVLAHASCSEWLQE